MRYEDKKILVISALMIATLSIFSYRNFRSINFSEIDEPLIRIPNIDLPSVEEMMSIDIDQMILDSNTIPSEFKYTDHSLVNKINFQYPSHWMRSDVGPIDGYEETMDHLFMAYSQDSTPTTIIGLKLESQSNLESAIGMIADIFRQEDIVMNILNEVTGEKEIYFEAEYLYQDGEKMISKEKIILLDGDAYLISVIGPDNWSGERHNQVSHIIDSIQIID